MIASYTIVHWTAKETWYVCDGEICFHFIISEMKFGKLDKVNFLDAFWPQSLDRCPVFWERADQAHRDCCMWHVQTCHIASLHGSHEAMYKSHWHLCSQPEENCLQFHTNSQPRIILAQPFLDFNSKVFNWVLIRVESRLHYGSDVVVTRKIHGGPGRVEGSIVLLEHIAVLLLPSTVEMQYRLPPEKLSDFHCWYCWCRQRQCFVTHCSHAWRLWMVSTDPPTAQ